MVFLFCGVPLIILLLIPQKRKETVMTRPDYVLFTNKEREIFLSQHGNFSPNQRDIFHKLCENWAPEINYDRFVKNETSNYSYIHTELKKIFQILTSRSLGLILTRREGNDWVPDKIILTPPESPSFYQYALMNWLNKMEEDPFYPFPLQKECLAQWGQVPQEFLTELTREAFNREAIAQWKDQEGVILFKATGSIDLLIAPSDLARLVQICRRKLLAYLDNSSLNNRLAAIMSLNLTNLQRQLEDKNPKSWIQICHSIVNNKAELIQTPRVVLKDDFFLAALIYGNFIHAEIQEAKKQKAAEKNREIDMGYLSDQIKSKGTELLNEEKLQTLMEPLKEKYGAQFEAFKREFQQKYLTPANVRTTAQINTIRQRYIHRENVLSLFRMEYKVAFDWLQKEYVEKMEYLIRSNQTEDTALLNKVNLDYDISRMVKETYPDLGYILENPRILAEAIIQTAKENGKISTIEEAKPMLSPFFLPDKIEFRPLYNLFKIDVYSLFESVFSKLPLWRQLLYRLTGRYESYRKKFEKVAHSIRMEERITRDQELSSRGRNPSDLKPGTRTDKGASSPSGGGRSAPRRRPKPPKPKSYSRRERERAWSDFGDTLKKKD